MRLRNYLTEEVKPFIVIKTPQQCDEIELDNFVEMIEEQDEAGSISERDIKKYGAFLAFAYIDGDLASVSSIKKPYRAEIFEYADVPDDIDPDDYPYELGWSYTKPEYQRKGLNYKLWLELEKKIKGKGIFATARVYNKASLATLKKKGFKIIGEPVNMSVFDIHLLIRR